MRALAAVATAFLLAGCFGSGDVSFTYRNNSPFGSDGEDRGTADCKTTGTLEIDHHIFGGAMTVQVLDGAGDVIFEQTWFAGNATNERHAPTGEKGSWTLSIQRTDLSGSYDIALRC